MRRFVEYLAETRTLVILLILLVIIGMSFGFTLRYTGGQLLDMKLGLAENQLWLANMTPAQRNAHLWITLTLDTLYPLAYGGALAGIAAHFAPRRAMIVVAPAFLLIFVDLSENMLILRALMGHDSILAAKVIATQLKWLLFGVAALIAIGTSLAALVRRYANPRSVEEN